MEAQQKIWQIASPLTPEAENNLQEYSRPMRQLLFNRGVATAERAYEYLNAIAQPLHDPYLLSGMQIAVERILAAIKNKENIVIYGDYDTDGVTASALMVQTLQVCGAQVQGYIPNRFEEGYGLNPEALDELKANGADLVVTVDCGIRAIEEVAHANQIGLALIVTDHHTPGAELPEALAVINPKKPGDEYPEKNLAGVGTAFKLASALLAELQPPNFNADDLLDLVTLGTIADLVPLVGENRALVQRGLARMRRPTRQGLLSLMGVAGITPASVAASHIGFSLGPRLNAAGRLASAMEAYNLLLCDDVFEAGKLAQALDNHNRERQAITREIIEKAEALAEAEGEGALLLYAADPSFNVGVVGLAASRLVEAYYRPAVVAQQEEAFTRASCRSIPEFHITHALEECADLLTHFGGHAAAAGFTVPNEHADELISRLKAIAKRKLDGKDLRPLLLADMEIQLNELDANLLRDLDKLQPTGYGNPEPIFVTRNLSVPRSRVVGKEGTHLKLDVSDGWVTFDAIAFRQGHWAGELPEKIDLLYNFEMNEFNGRQTLQLNVRDIKATE